MTQAARWKKGSGPSVAQNGFARQTNSRETKEAVPLLWLRYHLITNGTETIGKRKAATYDEISTSPQAGTDDSGAKITERAMSTSFTAIHP